VNKSDSPDSGKLTFPLSTEQHEILLAFEEEPSLTKVAARVRRDPSVVSRTLKIIAETAPFLEKQGGKWRITPLGRQVNRLTKNFLQTQAKLIDQSGTLRLAPAILPALGKRSALLLLGTQKGFLNPAWGPRNNADAETKMEKLLEIWRARGSRVIFCRHLSPKRDSPLFEGTVGCSFIPGLSPKEGEKVFQKSHNSAFADSDLNAYLEKNRIQNLIIAGFTTNHCVDATVRSAFDRGFNVFVISDATAAFDRVGPDGKNYSGEVLHAATLTSLHQEYATIVESEIFLTYLSEENAFADD
jgi:nicotinamidase-related amidase